MENTLVILKPSTIQRQLIGEIISRFEKKGLLLSGIKMVWLADNILNEHYAHLKNKPFFEQVKKSMKATPVIACCWTGKNAVSVVRAMAGSTNGREALPGTIRGDYSVSVQENIIHTSDSIETAIVELKRFFKEEELFSYQLNLRSSIYANEEI